jgi:tetratricopeptide (TPR) repeat protein/mono/diheme cytochrome c family protein
MIVASRMAAGATVFQNGSEPTSVTYNRDIAPVVSEHCAVCHHPGGPAPFSLVTYDQVRARAREIVKVTSDRYMPPWKPEVGYGDFVGERRLSDVQIQLIRAWVDRGAVEGDPAHAPPTRTWAGGWQLGKPDLVIRMPEPYLLKADAADTLRNFVVPIPVTRRRYVRGIEFLPGNPTVVHHANMRIDLTRASRQLDEEDPEPGYEGVTASSAEFPSGHFLGWTPGQVRPLAPDGLSWPVEPGADLVIQLHLRPTGKPETVQVTIGFFFTDTPPTRLPTMIRLERQNIDIAAGDRQYVVEDRFVLPIDVEAYELQPHAHYLAREVQGFARLPDGTTRWLIYIKEWDFAWQDVYRLAKPLSLPKGTTLVMRYSYDNSADNARNPHHPPQRVRFGQKSTDEMGSLWLQVFSRTPHQRPLLERAVGLKMIREDIVGYEQQLSADPGSASVHQSLAASYLQLGQGNIGLFHLQESIRLNPASPFPYGNMGLALVNLGRPGEAVPYLEQALRRKIPNAASVHNTLAVALHGQDRIDEALAHFREAITIDPHHSSALNNLGKALQQAGKPAEAIGYLERAVELRPDDAIPRRNLASAMASEGRMREAIVHYRGALERRPDWPDVLIDLAWILAAHPDAERRAPDEAIRLAERAVEITAHQDPGAFDVLGSAYAAASRFDPAIVAARTALAMATERHADRLTTQIRSRLQLYERHRPYLYDFSDPPTEPR